MLFRYIQSTLEGNLVEFCQLLYQLLTKLKKRVFFS
jgi:hypothetical protein